MPLYEYTCDKCRAQFTKLQPMSAPREGNECPCCAGKKTRRVLSSFATSGSSVASMDCGPGPSGFR